MTIQGVNAYYAIAIVAEIGDISCFERNEKLVSHADLTARQKLFGNLGIKSIITKHGPSVLIFILVPALNILMKYSKKMKIGYLSMVRS